METAPSDSELETWSKLHDVVSMLSRKLGPPLNMDAGEGDNEGSGSEEEEEAGGEEEEEANGEEEEEASGEEEEEASGEEEEEASGEEEEEASGEEVEEASGEDEECKRHQDKNKKRRQRANKNKCGNNGSDIEPTSPREDPRSGFIIRPHPTEGDSSEEETDGIKQKMEHHVKPVHLLKLYDLGPDRGVKKKI
jgi:hypothetical protein